MKVSIKHKITSAILFEYERENNSIKITLEIAIKKLADLRGADLQGADLRGADLRGVNLWGADLCGADLCGADLRGASLRGANLCGADLRGSNLWKADLPGADLRGADLEVKIPPIDHTFISEVLWRNAKTEYQKDFVSRIREVNRCWKYFYKLARQKQVLEWAEKILSQWLEYEDKIKELKS